MNRGFIYTFPGEGLTEMPGDELGKVIQCYIRSSLCVTEVSDQSSMISYANV